MTRDVRAAAGRRWFEGSGFGDGDDGSTWAYPWQSGSNNEGSEWSSYRETITFFTSEGVFQIHEDRFVSAATGATTNSPPPMNLPGFASPQQQQQRRFRESDYMDPNQKLCLGSLFDIRAFNGLDSGRFFCVVGFCRSAEMLCDVVEDSVIKTGGQVVEANLHSSSGLHERLRLTVAMPLLFGVPPALDRLNRAIQLGGGIVDKSFHQWEMCP